MTTLNEARKAVYERFLAAWPGISDGAPVQLDNEAFEQPENGPWARVTMRTMSDSQQTIAAKGSRSFRRRATIFVQVFVDPHKGTKDGDTLAKGVLDVFEGESFGGLDCFAGSARETGASDRWFGYLVQVPCDYHETK